MNIAMISKWHVHAPQYADILQKCDGCKISAVWDEDAQRGAQWAQELGAKFYSDYDMLLSDESIDAVAICSPTNMHCELMVKAARAKKHIFTEKVLALTSKEAEEIKKAVDESGIVFTISYPHRCRADLLKAKQIADSGEIGEITYARVRNVHDGSIKDWLPLYFYDKTLCGGGAMIDLGAHPMYLLEWILGEPVSVSSTFTEVTDRGVEDNAVSVIKFRNGRIGVSETGFVSAHNPFTLEISGTKGMIYVMNGLRYASENTDGKLVEAVIGENLPNPPLQWVESIKSGRKAVFDINEAVKLTCLMEAAYKSHCSKKEEPIA